MPAYKLPQIIQTVLSKKLGLSLGTFVVAGITTGIITDIITGPQAIMAVKIERQKAL